MINKSKSGLEQPLSNTNGTDDAAKSADNNWSGAKIVSLKEAFG